MSRLTVTEQLVFQTALLQADASVAEIASQLSLRSHSVRRAFESLKKNGVFLSKHPYLNPYLLGVAEYLIYLSLVDGRKSVRQAFLKAICDYDRVSLVAEVGGDYQFEIRFLAHHPGDLIEFLDVLSERFKSQVKTPAIAVIHQEEYSATSVVTTSKKIKLPTLGFSSDRRSLAIDEVDHLILSRMANQGIHTIEDLARNIGIPANTINYRISRMKADGLLQGYFYMCDSRPLKLHPTILLVESHILTGRQREKLLEFARKHDGIAVAHILVGPWQARIFARLKRQEDALSLVEELYELLPGTVQTIRVLPQLQFHKFSLYPFRSFKRLIAI